MQEVSSSILLTSTTNFCAGLSKGSQWACNGVCKEFVTEFQGFDPIV